MGLWIVSCRNYCDEGAVARAVVLGLPCFAALSMAIVSGDMVLGAAVMGGPM